MVRRRDRTGGGGNPVNPTQQPGPATGSPAPGGTSPAAADGALPPGYLLHEFQVERVLGQGGFGIVYLAQDLQLRRTVAVKEYMPTSMAVRQGDREVVVRSEQRRDTFELGLRSFVNEARLLASFDNPALIKVYRFWEQNGTAYMVMPYYQGPTLKAWLAAQDGPPSETWLKQLLMPLLDVLALIHADRCYHRDIAPDNILLLGDARPLLLDFGAARRVIGDATQALTVMLKPGYAPIEQYAEEPSMKQGPWTDVYALCAVLYMAISGRAPLAAVARMMKDDMVPLAVSAAGRYSEPFLAAIDAGLSVRPEHRPQDVAALRSRLFGTGDDDATRLLRGGATQAYPFVDRRRAVLPDAVVPPEPDGPAETEDTAIVEPPAIVPDPPARWPMMAGATALAVLAAIGWYALQRPNAPVNKVAQPAMPAQPAQERPVSVPAAPRPAYSPAAALDDLIAHRDPRIVVQAEATKARIVIGSDLLQFRITSSQPGYLYVYLVGTDSAHLQLLFPNGLDRNNRIDAYVPVTLPRKGWQITAGGPPGVDRIVAMVSGAPRDFSAAGLETASTIPEFTSARAGALWGQAQAGKAVFAGQAICPAQAPCDTGYGATLMHIEEAASP